MDFPLEDTREEKNIEDYLFSGYRPAVQKSTFDLDQQFARPIQDEDLFGFAEEVPIEIGDDEIVEVAPEKSFDPDDEPQTDLIIDPFPEKTDPEILDDTGINSPIRILEDDTNGPSSVRTPEKQTPVVTIDDLFPDDYSDSSNHGTNNIENANPVTYQKPKPLTPAQEKLKRWMETAKQLAVAKQRKPMKIGHGFSEKGTCDLTIEHHRIVSDTSSKLLFNKVFNKSKKNDDSHGTPKRGRIGRIAHIEALRKEICARKRKAWDLVNQPIEVVDEEAIVSGKIDGSDAEIENDDAEEKDDAEAADENDDAEAVDGESDGGIEALDREDISDSEDEQVSRKPKPTVVSEDEDLDVQERDELIEVSDDEQVSTEQIDASDNGVTSFLDLDAEESDSNEKTPTQTRRRIIFSDEDD